MSNHSNAETVVLVTLGFHSGSIKGAKTAPHRQEKPKIILRY